MNNSDVKNTAPTFTKSFFSNLRLEKSSIGMFAYIPYQFIILCVIPVLVIYFCDVRFYDTISDGDFINILSSIIVFIGILAAFSISAMTQIQTISSDYPFSDYLVDIKLFDIFIFYPQYTFILQSIYMTVSIFMVFAHLSVPIFEKYLDVMVTFNFGFALYVIYKTLGLVNLIRLLTWHYAKYKILFENS